MSEEQKQKNEPVNQGGSNSNPKFPKFNGYWIYGIILLLMISFFMVNQEEVVKKMPYSKFTDQVLPSGDIEMLTVITNESALEVTIKKDKLENYRDEFGDNFSALMEGGPHFLVKVPSVDSFVEDLRRVEQRRHLH